MTSNRQILDKKIEISRGRLIIPNQVKTIRNGSFGKEYIYNEVGEFFIMHSEFQEKFTELVQNDTIHLIIDYSYRCYPQGYNCALVANLHSYEKNICMPIYQVFMSNTEPKAFIFLVKKLTLFLSQKKVSPKYFTCDFNEVLVKALRDKYPAAIFIASFFHYCRALWRRCIGLGIAQLESTKECLYALQAISLMPPLCVLPNIENQRMKYINQGTQHMKFFDFFEKTFILGGFSILYWSLNEYLKDIEKLMIISNTIIGINHKLNRSINVSIVDALSAMKALEGYKKTEFDQGLENKVEKKCEDELLMNYVCYYKDRCDMDPFSSNGIPPFQKFDENVYVLDVNTSLSEAELENVIRVNDSLLNSRDTVSNIERNIQSEDTSQDIEMTHAPKEDEVLTFVGKLKRQIERARSTKYVGQLIEVQEAKYMRDWATVESRKVFKGEDGIVYYKKADGRVVKVNKLANSLLKKVVPEEADPNESSAGDLEADLTNSA